MLALAPWVPRERWELLESRVARNVDRLLELLARHSATATFFTLGWVAERQPAMVKAMAAAGHEVASHGYDHRRVTELTPEGFREQVRRTKAILEDLSGQPCLGYRAPNYSIVAGREWALDILVEEGYRYDSSLFPIRRPGYGYAGGGRDPHWLERPAGRLLEVPPATLRLMGLNLPAAGGAYFRLLPYPMTRFLFRRCAAAGRPVVFYLHPWELDAEQPRHPLPRLKRLRHYRNLDKTESRLRRLLKDFSFTSIRKTLSAGAA